MAHLITLTDADTREDILFNLDTVVSIENGNHSTIINTRWGNTLVKESLEEIMDKSRQIPDPTWITQKNV